MNKENNLENLITSKDPIKFFKILLPISLCILTFCAAVLYISNQNIENARIHMTKTEELRGKIIYFHEVLTMSARTAVLTGDLSWKKRYDNHVPKLDKAIKEAIKLVPNSYLGGSAKKTDQANQTLIKMELKSFELIKDKNIVESRNILFGKEYSSQKQIYAQGMDSFSKDLTKISLLKLKTQKIKSIISIGVASVLLAGIFICFTYVLFLMKKYRNKVFDYQKTLEEKVFSQTEDIQKNLSIIAEKNQQQAELIHLLCHDLKNPIGASLSAIELHDLKPESITDYISKIKTFLNSSLGIIDVIHDYMVLSEGKVKLKLEPVDIVCCIKESYKILDAKFNEKNICLSDIEAKSIMVLGEKNSIINSVFNNIFTNAIKFSKKGSIIKVIISEKDDNVEIEIIDGGIGIPKTIINNIFDPSKSTTRMGTDNEKGTGYGMPLVKKFIDAYGGTIKVKSNDIKHYPEAHGTTISLSLKSA